MHVGFSHCFFFPARETISTRFVVIVVVVFLPRYLSIYNAEFRIFFVLECATIASVLDEKFEKFSSRSRCDGRRNYFKEIIGFFQITRRSTNIIVLEYLEINKTGRILLRITVYLSRNIV